MKRAKTKAYQKGIKYIDFVKQWHQDNPKYSWIEAMKFARQEYHQMIGTPIPKKNYVKTKRKNKAKNLDESTVIEIDRQLSKKLLGGAKKGALAALLSGLDANISIK